MRTISLLGIVFTLAACGHDGVGPSPPSSTIAGTYDLTTVDGQVLPFTALDLGAYQAKLVSGTLRLSTDGTYSFQFSIRIEDSGNVRTAADSLRADEASPMSRRDEATLSPVRPNVRLLAPPTSRRRSDGSAPRHRSAHRA